MKVRHVSGGLLLGALFVAATAVPASATVVASVGDIDLSGTIVKAINFASSDNKTVNGVTFLGAPMNSTVDDVTNASGGITSGVAAPEFGATADADALEDVFFLKLSANPTTSVDATLANGNYTVQLLIHEGWFLAAGGRVGDISIEGVLVADEYDAFVEQGSDGTQGSLFTHTLNLTDGNLDIDIVASPNSVQAAFPLSGLIITQTIVPEPASMILMFVALIGAGVVSTRHRRQSGRDR